jgi:hypothetical protein
MASVAVDLHDDFGAKLTHGYFQGNFGLEHGTSFRSSDVAIDVGATFGYLHGRAGKVLRGKWSHSSA